VAGPVKDPCGGDARILRDPVLSNIYTNEDEEDKAKAGLK